MSDLISKQAAIELVMEYCPDDDGSVGELGDLRELLDELENLPSAQQWNVIHKRPMTDEERKEWSERLGCANWMGKNTLGGA